MKRIIYFILISIFIVSCSKSESLKNRKASKQMAESLMTTNGFYDSMAVADNVTEVQIEEIGAVENTQNIQRKLIKNGYITITVKDISACAKSVDNFIKEMNGYISNSNVFDNNSSFSYTIRIPSNNFDKAMSLLGDFGKVKNQSISTEDVTDRYYDLESRINTKKVLQEKYAEYLKKADNIKDLLEIEAQLNTVTGDLELIQGQMKRLSNQIDYSTINVTFYSENPYKEESSIEWPDLTNSWNNFVSKVMAFLVGFIKVIIYIVIFGTPIVGLVLLLFWLLFGKIGLLKKLFRRLK